MWQRFLREILRVPYRLHAEELAAPNKPAATIIMLHGIGSSLGMWRPLAAKLPQNIRVIAIDLLGFGASPKPHLNIYNARMQANSIAATLARERIRGKVIIVGHSLGTLVAIEFARRYPLLVKHLVLVSPPLYNEPDTAPKGFNIHPRRTLRRIHQLLTTNPGTAERILSLAKSYNLLNKGFDASNINTAAYLATLEMTIINQNAYQHILSLECPIDIITGRLDAVVADATIKSLVDARQNIRHTSVPFAAHEIIGPLEAATVRTISRIEL